MAYSAVPSKSANDTWSDTDNNTYIRDNFAAGVPDIFTTKGDIAVASAADVAGRLAVGTDGQILTAASGETLGVKWASLVTAVARYEIASTQTISNTTQTIINYATEIYDPDSAVTTGASWKYTVPSGKDGYFLVMAHALLQAATGWAENEYAQISLYKNNALFAILGESFAPCAASSGFQVYVHGATIISLVATDYIDVRIYHNNGGNVTLDNTATVGHIAIVRLSV